MPDNQRIGPDPGPYHQNLIREAISQALSLAALSGCSASDFCDQAEVFGGLSLNLKLDGVRIQRL